MPDQELLKNVRKVLSILDELKNMSDDGLRDICMQYGEATKGNRDELIQRILKVEATENELADYQKYLRFYYFASFREQAKGLSSLDANVSEIEKLFVEKANCARERRRAEEAERNMGLILSNALPLVRLNIEYSHVESDYKAFIKVMTSTGMERAKLADELEELKRKNPVSRFLKKGTIQAKEENKEAFEARAQKEFDGAYQKYTDSMKAYGSILRELFYKMLDDREIASAVLLYRNLPMDFTQPEAYQVQHISDPKITPEEKEAIFDEFLSFARFDPEVDLTGEIFYERVMKFVNQYHTIMASRNALKESNCVGKIKEIVTQQRSIVDQMKKREEEVEVFDASQTESLSLIYEDQHRRKK